MEYSCEIYALKRLIERYDYDGAIEILELMKLSSSTFHQLVLSCHRALDFNFGSAKALTDAIPRDEVRAYPQLLRHINELPRLIKGEPHDIFNELLDNLTIQLERQEYTDFVGRIFQLRELLYKYAVIQFKHRKDYSLRDRIYQKQVFEHTFKLQHGLMNGMKEVLRQGGGRWQKIVNVLSGKQMADLMDLRHRTIVAHGIETVSLNDIQRIYQSTDNVIDDLHKIFQWLNIPLWENKYKLVNQDLQKMFGQLLLDGKDTQKKQEYGS